MSGWRSIIQRGGVAVGVPSTTPSPADPRVSIARSSQSNRSSPGRGSMRDQANSPMRTRSMPARTMRDASSAQIASGQCSG